MRLIWLTRVWIVLFAVVFLNQCVAPALILSPQSQILWALLKPMVGLDPKETNLFRQPILQSRLEPLLGTHYASAVQLLETADKIQQEGPLFYVVSKYTPVPELAEKAGFVWNSDTNQMAVLLVSGGAPQVFAEKLNAEIAEQVPIWPAELSDYTDPEKLKQQALAKAKTQISEQVPVPAAMKPVVQSVETIKNLPEQAKTAIAEKQQALVNQALKPLTDTKQQAEQQLQKTQSQVLEKVTAPVKDTKQQLEQIERQTKSNLSTPVSAVKQQADQQLQQVKDGSVHRVTAPTQEVKQEVEQQLQVLAPSSVNLTQPSTSVTESATRHLDSRQKDMHPKTAGLPAETKAAVSTSPSAQQAAIEIENDIDAELAAEQQTLTNQRAASDKTEKIAALQQEITAISKKLTENKDAKKAFELQQQLQQLKDRLHNLQTSK